MDDIVQMLVCLALLVVVALLSGWFFSHRTRRKVSYMLDALEDNETNFRFREDRFIDRRINKTLNRMKRIFDKEKAELREREVYYGIMLDNVNTGIVVVDDDKGHVAYSNVAALELLGISSLLNLRQLNIISPSLTEAFFRVTQGHEEKANFVNEVSQKAIALTSSEASIGRKKVKIIAFNDISSEMEETEADSWSKLIRVITHEIMNTVTPIASLSDALAGYAASHTPAEVLSSGQNGGLDFKDGLETIAASSKGLIKFVESYRNLTHLPAPLKKVLYLKDVVARVFKLSRQQMFMSGISCSYEENPADVMIYADEDLIFQILINMLKNAVQAEATDIKVSARVDASDNVIVDIANNGQPIPKESCEEIFVPFFTTKPSGSGIGLNISRQIMRRHNGSLILSKSTETETVFSLIFR